MLFTTRYSEACLICCLSGVASRCLLLNTSRPPSISLVVAVLYFLYREHLIIRLQTRSIRCVDRAPSEGSIERVLSENCYICGPSDLCACVHLSNAFLSSIACPICLHMLPRNHLAHFNFIFFHSPHTTKEKVSSTWDSVLSTCLSRVSNVSCLAVSSKRAIHSLLYIYCVST